MNKRVKTWSLIALYAVVFTEVGISMPFMPLWLDALGLDAAVIGVLLALPIATRIVATAPLMSLLDQGLGPRRMILAGSLALSLTYALMPGAAGIGWPLLALFIVLNAVAGAPLVPCIDYLTLAAVRQDSRLAYSRIRMAGSIAFLLANLAGGFLLSALGGQVAVPLLLTGLALGAAVVAWRSRSVTGLPRVETGAGRPKLPLKLWLCIGAAAAIQASHGAIYGFGSIYWTSAGIPAAWVGSLWAVGVLSEIGLFAVMPTLPAAWRSPVRLLSLGAAAAILRAVGMFLVGDRLAALVPLQALHGLTFGATQLGAMAAVSAYAPDGARGRAQGMLSAVNASIAVVATLVSGLAYRAGGPLAFLLMAPLAIAGLGLALASREVKTETDRQP
ncbi:MFS transporter, PPP family, 3-phenylpropionic acid transporter [Methylobacterium phyllostachyos]|uniref:MFS transporter, PPP family, 3-phenylpropionic acid transporter n=1 Tax=Methylobacterium phyllostachyos TaxID=582672 RepID=A0A1G9XYX2_9HYPH|nr:MFS transporter [Methylobacterium phyllostachyos]SDN01930.1 MFS transporter, PPP family, 3-phenylpropionic acid transporter [Methylobacterium phyllostachyos]